MAMEWCEKHLRRGLKVVGTREVGPDEFECDECFRGLPINGPASGVRCPKRAAAQPAAEIKEEMKMARVLVDDDKLVELHKQGLSDKEIAEGIGCGYVATSAHRRALGLQPNASGGGRKTRAASALSPAAPKRKPKAAMVAVETRIVDQDGKSEILQAGPESEVRSPEASDQGDVSVVMFKIRGSNATLLAAIEAVKTALAR